MKKQPRKTRRQLQSEKLAAAQKVVKQANNLENPLNSIEQFHSYKLPDGSTMKLHCNSVKQLSNAQLIWIFDLMQRNMEDMYRKSSWGWDAVKKQQELTQDNAWYLIGTVDETNVGFSHFQFDIDDGVDVLYCYELQLEESFRRKGIGKFMMKALEAMAHQCEIQKVVLTVFKQNISALSFFKSLRYKPDITNPSESQNVDYTILSKRC